MAYCDESVNNRKKIKRLISSLPTYVSFSCRQIFCVNACANDARGHLVCVCVLDCLFFVNTRGSDARDSMCVCVCVRLCTWQINCWHVTVDTSQADRSTLPTHPLGAFPSWPHKSVPPIPRHTRLCQAGIRVGDPTVWHGEKSTEQCKS